MKLVKRTILIIVAIFLSLDVFAQSETFKMGKSIDVYYSTIRELYTNYVDTVEVDKLVNTSIKAMLSSLDPYTGYIPEKDQERIEIMTTGAYGGIGAVIKKIDSLGVLISQPYPGTPAVKYGLEPGDIILEINKIPVKDLTAEECSNRMKGMPGTDVKFRIYKARTKDTIDLVVTRERVHVSDVVYSGIIRDSIGYIKIQAFTKGGAEDVKKSFLDLSSTGKMKELVLDFRSNGGGLMDEAVNIVSLFVPKGSEVVSARGRASGIDHTYYTKDNPVDSLIPIMVMVNSSSASSSEIVAGALQDMDRAIIAGVRTFGKGLVQSIRDVGYNDKIKLTTAKYYTPSGRCVQAIDYSHRNEDGSAAAIPDSLKKAFYTKGGRTVYDGGGIAPDLEAESEIYSRVSASLIINDILGDYAIKYYQSHDSIAAPSEFLLTDEQYEDFVKYASAREFDHRTSAAVQMDKLLKAAKMEKLYDEYEAEIEALGSKLLVDKSEVLHIKKPEVKSLLEDEIICKYYYYQGEIESSLQDDYQLYEALDKVDYSLLKKL